MPRHGPRQRADQSRSPQDLARSKGSRTGEQKPPRATAFQSLVERSDDGMILADTNGIISYANLAAARLLGFSQADLVGRVGFDMCRPEDLPKAREAFGKCLEQPGEVVPVRVAINRGDGTVRVLAVTLSSQGDGRGAGMVTVIFRDQTDASVEAQLRQAQKMEAVGRMTGGIAHDFNNVLSIIIANAELVAGAVGTEGSETSEDLAELMAAAERGAAMVRKLLGFSRHADLKLEPTDLSDLVDNLGGMLRHLVPAHIALRVTTVSGATGMVDAGAVEQIMMNLATNARDAMARAGELRIDVRPAVVRTEDASVHSWVKPGEFVCISVADTGAGMDDATLTRIFEPFFTTKAAGVGTGLGLAMVYGLVKQQRGFIRVESTVGKGTTVSLYFPRASGTGSRPARVSRRHRSGGHETILLLEDDEDLRRTANRVLMTLGYRVLLAADGREGLAMYRARRDEIDLVVSDIVLPHLTGPEVYDAIRRENPSVKFLLSSGYRKGDVPDIPIPIDLPLLLKPWSVETMARTIREVLDSGGSPGDAS